MKIKGIAASDGYAIARAYKLSIVEIAIPEHLIENVDQSVSDFERALVVCAAEIEQIKIRTTCEIDLEHGEIFDAHLQMLNDPEIVDQTLQKIKGEQLNPAKAYHDVTTGVIKMFQAMDDDYFRERAADIKDVSQRMLAVLLNIDRKDHMAMTEDVVVIAYDLTPSETAQLDKEHCKGFVTDIGGRTSHSSIMARTLEIPAVVGTKNSTTHITDGDLVIVDGIAGEVIVNPSDELLGAYTKKMNNFNKKRAELQKMKGQPTTTSCHKHIELAANIGSPNDIDQVIDNDAEGIGLYRTEFLYMNKPQMPTEDEQFEAYKVVLEKMAPKPVVIRTLDIGGDKKLPYLELPQELNPFLGYRAIRLCLDQTHILETQLRALLRASVYGNLKIMFPMIATIEEFLSAKAIYEKQRESLIAEGVTISGDIELGIMVEIPATALLADQFAEVVDFFSIGTNDLIQYSFAADRMNERVAYLYQPYHPALLRLIKMVIDASHRAGKWTGMCGEMAGDSCAIPLLIGLGLDEFSMSATSVLSARKLIRQLDFNSAKTLATRALDMRSNDDVKKLVTEYLKEHIKND